MTDKIGNLITDIYYMFNSACIIDYDALTIDAPECTITFESADAMTEFLLNEIKESIDR